MRDLCTKLPINNFLDYLTLMAIYFILSINFKKPAELFDWFPIVNLYSSSGGFSYN